MLSLKNQFLNTPLLVINLLLFSTLSLSLLLLSPIFYEWSSLSSNIYQSFLLDLYLQSSAWYLYRHPLSRNILIRYNCTFFNLMRSNVTIALIYENWKGLALSNETAPYDKSLYLNFSSSMLLNIYNKSFHTIVRSISQYDLRRCDHLSYLFLNNSL